MSDANGNTPTAPLCIARDTTRPHRRLKPLMALFSVVIMGTGGAEDCESRRTKSLPYADTEWSSVHSGPRNDNFVDTGLALQFEPKWTALEGAATVVAPTVGPEGNVYQTTGQAPGTSGLHAFDRDGNLLWKTPAWQSPDDFDSCSIWNAAIIDESGDLYVSDCNQFWAFHSDGEVKWVIDLPPAPDDAPFQDSAAGPINSFVTGIFTKDGSVGGVTLFGDIVIVNRLDGSLAAPVASLPGGPALPGRPTTPTLWGKGLVDPGIIEPLNALFFAGIFESVNTPAVDPKSGRIFVTGTDVTPGLGALYGVDFKAGHPPMKLPRGKIVSGKMGEIEFAFASMIGPGSGSSPALSPDGTAAYVSDDSGLLFSIDTATGETNWSIDLAAEPGSAAVGGDGTIYVLAGQLAAINPDGTLKWFSDVSERIDDVLPPDPDFVSRVAIANGIPGVTNNALMLPCIFQYIYLFQGVQPVPVPVFQTYIPIDPETGRMIDGAEPYFGALGSNEAFVVPLRDGDVLLNSGDFVTTVSAGLNPLIAPLLPEGFETLSASGGLEAISSLP